MQVLKFGGSSVSDAGNISKVVSIVSKSVKKSPAVAVVSAIGGCTDSLIEIGKTAASGKSEYTTMIARLEKRHSDIIGQLFPEDYDIRPLQEDTADSFRQLREICRGIFYLKEISKPTLDLIMSFGELLSSKILSEKLMSMGIKNRWLDARDMVKTRLKGQRQVVDIPETYSRINALIKEYDSRLYIVQGFIAGTSRQRTATLGRGGSDYSASLIAAAVNAEVLQIWSDVDGMMTADPHIVPRARTIEYISYREARELSHFGAKVVYPPSILPAVEKAIPIEIRNTFSPEHPGSCIESTIPKTGDDIRGVCQSGKIALLSVRNNDTTGIAEHSARLFGALAGAGIDIVMVTQASSIHSICIAVTEDDAEAAYQVSNEIFSEEIRQGKIEAISLENGLSILSIVGNNVGKRCGTGVDMLETLGENGINVKAIAQGYSGKNISAIISAREADVALKVLHRKFFEENTKRLNLFIAGYGKVGKELVSIIKNYNDSEIPNKKHIHIAGLCNSRKMVFRKSGLEPAGLSESIEEGENSDIRKFREKAETFGLKNSIMVDCTADRLIASSYTDFLKTNMSVVTCNKIALADSYEKYEKIREVSSRSGSAFLYETTVGAALPVISTIRQMLRGGDRIHTIEAILSGTLNYLFSNYDGSTSFAELLRKARELGYSEPNPAIDISGTDVIRKTVILARECGRKIEPGDISVQALFPPDILNTEGDELYEKLRREEKHIRHIYEKAKAEGRRLRYVSRISDTGCEIGLQAVDVSHPLYGICDRDNAVIIFSRNYSSPIKIIGAGAGAKVTASGLFNDIISSI